MLVHRGEEHSRYIPQDVLGAVAVVDVEIQHGDRSDTTRPCLQGGHRHRAQVAEAHDAFPLGMMSRGPEQAERRFARQGEVQGPDRPADGPAGVVRNPVVPGRVGIEIPRRAQPGEVARGMGAQEGRVRHLRRRGPRQRQRLLSPEQVQRARHPGGLLGVAGTAIAEAAFIGDDGHGPTMPAAGPVGQPRSGVADSSWGNFLFHPPGASASVLSLLAVPAATT